MGIGELYKYNRNLIDIKIIEEKKDINSDFGRLYNLIKDSKSSNQFNIPPSFKFLKIKEFFLGLQNFEEIYEKYSNEFEKRGLGREDSVHASLLFSFSDDCNYFLDYFPDRTSNDYTHFYPKESKGLRYKPMTIKEFINKNSVCLIKFKSDKNISFYELFEKIFSMNKWKYNDYNLEKNNCCHFAEFILKELDSKLFTGKIIDDIIFTKYIDYDEKEKFIRLLIPKIFLTYLLIYSSQNIKNS